MILHYSVTVSTGSTVLIFCNVTDTANSTIQWYIFEDGVKLITSGGKFNISSSTSHSFKTELLTISNFQPQDAGFYACYATNIAGTNRLGVTLQS